MRFRLRTLLIVITCVALTLVAAGSPTDFWSGAFVVITVVTLLVAILGALCSRGTRWAMAVGYLVFCGGYLVHVTLLADWQSRAMNNGTTTLWSLFRLLYDALHSGTRRLPANQDTRANFSVIGHHALACVLGCAGAMLGKWLAGTVPPGETRLEKE
jgi:hypothetical protein